MKRQHLVRESEKEAMHLMYWGLRGIVVEPIDSQVQCIWIL